MHLSLVGSGDGIYYGVSLGGRFGRDRPYFAYLYDLFIVLILSPNGLLRLDFSLLRRFCL